MASISTISGVSSVPSYLSQPLTVQFIDNQEPSMAISDITLENNLGEVAKIS